MTSLVLQSNDVEVLTAHAEMDATSALCRGLADYMRDTRTVAYGGRDLRWDHVAELWAPPETIGTKPAAAIYPGAPSSYDASKLSPAVVGVTKDGFSLFVSCELVLDPLNVEVWSTDPEERGALCKMLEDAFSPVEWMYGFRLRLPHYHGAFADFAAKSVYYRDSEEEAMRGHRVAVIPITASVAVMRAQRLPMAQTRIEVSVDNGPVIQLPKS